MLKHFPPLFSCDGCERKPVVGVRYKCKTCDNFDFCEHCFANKTDHDHNFVAYHRSKKGQHPIEAGKPGRARTEWCHSSSEKHLCIKEMTVSSNEHMAAKMINKEIDMPWISEKAFGAVSFNWYSCLGLGCLDKRGKSFNTTFNL